MVDSAVLTHQWKTLYISQRERFFAVGKMMQRSEVGHAKPEMISNVAFLNEQGKSFNAMDFFLRIQPYDIFEVELLHVSLFCS